MKYKIQNTNDESHTILNSETNETYHSMHGAISESRHVFINNGLLSFKKKHIDILEIGFGTGLNAFLSLIESNKRSIKLNYRAIDPNIIEIGVIEKLNYHTFFNLKKNEFLKIHTTKWNKTVEICNNFNLTKHHNKIEDFKLIFKFDLIYFDAFSPRKQPELWTKSIFSFLYEQLNNKGILVSYCAKGSVKRMLQKVGFKVMTLKGPPGKREMIKAIKLVKN